MAILERFCWNHSEGAKHADYLSTPVRNQSQKLSPCTQRLQLPNALREKCELMQGTDDQYRTQIVSTAEVFYISDHVGLTGDVHFKWIDRNFTRLWRSRMTGASNFHVEPRFSRNTTVTPTTAKMLWKVSMGHSLPCYKWETFIFNKHKEGSMPWEHWHAQQPVISIEILFYLIPLSPGITPQVLI